MTSDVEPKNAIFKVSQFQKMILVSLDTEKLGESIGVKIVQLLHSALSYKRFIFWKMAERLARLSINRAHRGVKGSILKMVYLFCLFFNTWLYVLYLGYSCYFAVISNFLLLICPTRHFSSCLPRFTGF